ncbi:MAG: TetR/AcrR family transcriptional regulator [Candidatus Latescibacteria bacterium]|nr:TetR/AcrR family transcriptional regulator [Candidatus Latescibacterota bacterium]
MNDVNTDDTLTRREREKLRHRKEIMDAATRVFARKGFFNATLDEVAQEAEFSKGTLYLHFSSKEDILYELLREKSDEILGLLKETFAGTGSFREEVENLFRIVAKMAFEHRDFFSIVMAHHANHYKVFSKERSDEFNARHNRIFSFADDRILKARRKGEIRDIPPEAIRGMLHGALDNMVMTRWCCETIECLYDKIDCFTDILFNGIAQAKEASR